MGGPLCINTIVFQGPNTFWKQIERVVIPIVSWALQSVLHVLFKNIENQVECSFYAGLPHAHIRVPSLILLLPSKRIEN